MNVFVPYEHLDNFIFSKKDTLSVNKEFLDGYLPERHILNHTFETLKLLSSYDFEIKDIKINIFIELYNYLFNFTLIIPEIISSVSNENLSLNRLLKLNSLSLKLTTLKIPKTSNFGFTSLKSLNSLNSGPSPNLSNLEEILKLMRTVEKQTNLLFNDFTVELLIEASDFRFYKPEKNIMHKLKESKLREFNNSNCNTKITVSINKILLNYSQQAVINLLLFCKCFENYKTLRKNKREKALKTFKSVIFSFWNENTGKKQISWVNEKLIRKNEHENKIIQVIYYTFLVMNKRQHIMYNISKYLVLGLIMNYRKTIGKEHAIIDFLIERNINIFLNAPSISNIGNMFMSIKEIERHINRAENKKLRDFIFHIVKEYCSGKNIFKF